MFDSSSGFHACDVDEKREKDGEPDSNRYPVKWSSCEGEDTQRSVDDESTEVVGMADETPNTAFIEGRAAAVDNGCWQT